MHFIFWYFVKIKLSRRHWHKWQKVKGWTGRRRPLFDSENSNSYPFNQQQHVFCFAFLARSVLDTEPCLPVWAVYQEPLSGSANFAKTIVGRCSEASASWGLRFEKNIYSTLQFIIDFMITATTNFSICDSPKLFEIAIHTKRLLCFSGLLLTTILPSGRKL